MGFLNRLLGIGVTVGATVAAVKVAEQVKENNPDGIKDVNGDGKVDAKDYFEEVKKAATEVYQDAAASFKEKEPEFSQKAKDATDDVKEVVINAAAVVKEKAPEYAEKAKDAVLGAKDAVLGAFDPKDSGSNI